MNVWKLIAIFFFVFSFLPKVMANQSPEGLWTTFDDNTGKERAIVHLFVQDGELTGTVDKIYPKPGDTGLCSKCPGEFKDKPSIGLKFVWGLKEKSPGTWEDGYILDGETGKIYHVKMTVNDNKLYVRGYVGISMLGRTQVWTRD